LAVILLAAKMKWPPQMVRDLPFDDFKNMLAGLEIINERAEKSMKQGRG